jgi:uncharacterized protein (DUF2252 family)
MMANPFAFYRGAAAIMAYDLSHTPSTGLKLQACGDCHLLNFGGFATAERRIILDINDFDEKLEAAEQSAHENEFAKLAFAAGETPRIVDQPRSSIICPR